ncbi:hypothetical protein CVT25_015054 [Psilocybe cyanescens]|uniref:RING-type domain-containing protein n=1 Tax=Psilocybe cyanescens TaxID=93625 RepID=A0A409WRX7_PSICY|nr:hypothetical protein CVT25_015054 [Psilocybe cyanescens]
MSQNLSLHTSPHRLTDANHSLSQVASTSSLKRRASPSFECPDDNSRKKMKEGMPDNVHQTETTASETSQSFIDDLVEELQCGCCSELVYKPVLVMPCQHFFCGSCCVLWIRNGGTNCPACRGVATIAMPFRSIQPLIEILLRNAPERARTQRERDQADEVYKAGLSIRIPPPREASPPPDVNRSTEYVHPCPHCLPNNPYDWRCPQPIVDPSNDIDHAWHIDDGVPPGHGNCGNCENLLALRAPTTTKCDLCLVSFCGIGVQDRCMALPLLSQHPHNMSTHADLIQSTEVYECFEGNTVEVEIMLEYLDAQSISPRHIYREIVQHIQKQPRGFATLLELELFTDVHSVAPGPEPSADSPRTKACRLCAAEIFLWGLREWWVRERKKGFLEQSVMSRKDCPDAGRCVRQKNDLAHAKEYNHIFPSRNLDDEEQDEAPGRAVEAAGAYSLTTAADEPHIPPRIATPMQVTQNISSTSSPSVPNDASSASSLAFLLNVDQDTDMMSPPQYPSSTSDPCNPE